MSQKRHKARKAKRRAWHMQHTKPSIARDLRRGIKAVAEQAAAVSESLGRVKAAAERLA